MNSTATNPYLIAIAGPSCAGKTRLALALCDTLTATHFGLDAYYHDLSNLTFEQRCHFNFDEPAALESGLLIEQVGRLAQGEAIERPIYDFSTHNRTGQTERIVPAAYVIIEGLFALYWAEIRELCGTKVFVDARDGICLARRQYRDVRERGRSEESVAQQFQQTVRPMADLHVRPTRAFADVIVNGEEPIEQSAEAVLRHVQAVQERRTSLVPEQSQND
jgi:uridine kinase